MTSSFVMQEKEMVFCAPKLNLPENATRVVGTECKKIGLRLLIRFAKLVAAWYIHGTMHA